MADKTIGEHLQETVGNINKVLEPIRESIQANIPSFDPSGVVFPHEPNLMELAQEKFPHLTESELHLIACVAEGEIWSFIKWYEICGRPSDSEEWMKLSTLRAEVIAWLINDIDARELISNIGIQIVGAKIDGKLISQNIDFGNSLIFVACVIPDDMELKKSIFKTLNFSGSHIGSLYCDMAKVEKNVLLINGFEAKGSVLFLGTEIGGDLNCQSGKFLSNIGIALFADQAKVKGNVFLNEGFKAKGIVLFRAAEIEGIFNCRYGKFLVEKGAALVADRLKVNGNVYLTEGFEANGTVVLSGAEIGGDLDCNYGTFNAGSGNKDFVLDASLIEVKGSALFNGVFRGSVSLQQADIKNKLAWCGKSEPKMTDLDLRDAKMHTLWIGRETISHLKHVYLQGMTTETLHGGTPWDSTWWNDFICRQTAESPETQEAIDNKDIPCPFLAQPYEHAAEHLRKRGYTEHAKEVLIAKGHMRRTTLKFWKRHFYKDIFTDENGKPREHTLKLQRDAFLRGLAASIQWLWYTFIWRWAGYGHRSSPLMVLAVLWVLLVGYGFSNADMNQVVVPSPKEVVSVLTDSNYPRFNGYTFSIESFTPLIKLKQVDFWQVNQEMPYGCALSYFMLFHKFLGYIIVLVIGGTVKEYFTH